MRAEPATIRTTCVNVDRPWRRLTCSETTNGPWSITVTSSASVSATVELA